MLIVLYCILLLVLGYISFCFPIGIIVFRKLCVRSVYEKKSVVDSASHVKDERIMEPLLEAKERWETKPLEKISIKMVTPTGIISFFKSLQSNNNLFADLWMHTQFEKNKTIAILVHGFTDSSAGMAYLAESYNERGVSTLSVNLRGHGESDGAFSGLGFYKTDGADIKSWVSYILKRFGEETKIILHGVSMGGSTVLQAAYAYSLAVHLVISDCSFSEYSKNIKKMLRAFFPKDWFSSFLTLGIYASTSLLNVCVNGFFFNQNNPVNIIKNSSKANIFSTIFFHGEADTLVSYHCAQELYDVSPNQKSIDIIDKAPHIGSWFYEKEKYMNEVFKYLQD